MKRKGLKTIALCSLLSTSLFAGFDSMNQLQSSSHTSNTASQNEQITISWNQAIPNGGDNLGGYYYLLDQSENTLIPNAINSRSTLGTGATSVTITKSDDGVYHFHLAPYADSGNIGATLHFQFIKIDKTVPTALSISPNGGSFNSVQTVSMSASDANNFSIYYTKDGTNPTKNSTLYGTAFSVVSTQTIKAVAIDSAENESSISSATFTINNTSNVAQFGNEITGGSIIATKNDAGSSTFVPVLSVEGSSITEYKFKIDTSSYSAQIVKATPINISDLSDGVHTVSIIGYDGTSLQLESEATTLSFTVDNTAPNNVTFSTASNETIIENRTITMNSNEGSTIYYSTDGSVPDQTSTQNSTVALTSTNNGTFTLRAIAFDTSSNKSSVEEAIYTLNIPISDDPSPINTPSSTNDNSDSNSNPTVTSISLPFETDTGAESVNIISSLANTTQTTNTDGTVIILASVGDIKNEVQVHANGTIHNQVTIGTITSNIEVNTVGADTQINSDGSMTISSNILNEEGSSISSNIEIQTNGTIINRLNITVKDGKSIESTIQSDIIGTDIVIGSDGSITMIPPIVTNTKNQKIEFKIVLDSTGEVNPSLLIDGKNIPLPQFEIGSKISIKRIVDKILLNIETVLTKTVTFN